jgi:hypothetical protein
MPMILASASFPSVAFENLRAVVICAIIALNLRTQRKSQGHG